MESEDDFYSYSYYSEEYEAMPPKKSVADADVAVAENKKTKNKSKAGAASKGDSGGKKSSRTPAAGGGGQLKRHASIIRERKREIERRAATARLERRSSVSSVGAGRGRAEDASYTADSLYELYPANENKLEELGGVEGVAKGVGSSTTRGVKSSEVPTRKERFGVNRLPDPDTKGFVELCWDTLNDFILLLLIAAAFISLILGMAFTDDADDSDSAPPPWVEGTAILIAVIIVVLVTAINDFKREKQFQKLNKIKDARDVNVIRAESEGPVSISVHDVVVGDLLVLSTGDIVPVDGLYVSGSSCATDESGQTGEPDLCRKSGDKPFFISGSKIQEGNALMLVTGVGINSHNGRAVMALRVPPEDTPLQRQLDTLARAIGKLGIAIAGLLFVILAIKYFVTAVSDNERLRTARTLDRLTSFVTTGITIAVVAVPEGLPLAVTIALAYAMLRMLREKNLVRTLAACETMGRATVIASDKTGTLTANQMTVVDGIVAAASLDGVDQMETAALGELAERWRDSSPHDSLLHALVENIAINSTAAEVERESGNIEWSGSTTEMALLEFARNAVNACPGKVKSLASYDVMRKDAKLGHGSLSIVETFPFSSSRKRSAVVVEREGAGYRFYVKGAAERVLAACTQVMDSNGQARPMRSGEIAELEAKIGSMADDALRTLCLAHRDYATMPENEFSEEDMSELVLDGLFGIHDVIRSDVPGAVRAVQRAGVRVIMVTGDNLATAKAIGTKCHIYDAEHDVALEGPDFAQTTNAELKHILPNLTVVARAAPLDKQRLVDRLQTDFGEVVAVTGDGTNDAPALSKADIGFGMGITGTDVAKEAADIILMDDAFSSIVVALRWGRSVYDSIRKFLQFQLTVNIVAVTVAFVGAVANEDGESPLKAVQLLWVNLIMDTLGALALATDPPTDELLERMPTRMSDSLIAPTMWINILGQATFQLAATLWLLFDGHNVFDLARDSTEHHTLVFNAFVWCQLFNEINAHSYGKPGLNPMAGIVDNRLFVVIWIGLVLAQVFIVEVGGDFASTTGQTGTEWLLALAIGIISLPIGFLLRLIPVMDPERTRENVNMDRLKGLGPDE
ncbi:P-type ATPase [Thecamonas trahens ATCC 50062]|uniref:Calcium-transporting ATPase n=1 Tax=Thecamonas trahens ATCC 50062 TaxID=461836 RepID=A0A0L0DKW9_THETB|nr:P-type ATPase [Thecamonas trahens ATCC 50062]KNC52008.1 P-type ATPase [Thecamonas trahens ATCC 50062]|eukprot:XP_013755591.1 P-type ATPase [Thecamonas trahens ATCC 50062]